MIFVICQRVWKTVKCPGKIRERSGNFEVDDKWQPCVSINEVDTLKWQLLLMKVYSSLDMVFLLVDRAYQAPTAPVVFSLGLS